jgi:hypothetical protein
VGKQNPIENINSVFNARLSKNVFIRVDILKFVVHSIVLCFNDSVSQRE